MPASVPVPGQLVEVRRRRYVVQEVVASALPPNALAPRRTSEHLVQLTSVEDDGLGEELQVVWEVEPGARVLEKAALPEPTGFDDPARLQAFLDAIRWGAVSSADSRELHAPFRAGIEPEDYQLDPVVRALQMPRVNLLIADDVGLGKTIEAGLVAQELILRNRARTVLVVCPAGLQIQWREQMQEKFGLEFRIIDSDGLRELRRKRGLHVNPWTHFPRLITSIDYLKRDRPMRLFREVLPAEGEAAFPRRFDLLIIDEAHNVAPAGASQYAVDSMRTEAIRKLAPHFEHKLFLTATPHNGYVESFTSLLELLDDQRFHRGVTPDRNQLAAVMVRRMKSELPKRWDGRPRFPVRRLEPLEVEWSAGERRAHGLLQEYADLRLSRADAGKGFATEFVLKLLKKRLLSSPAAFLATLEKHIASVGRAAPASPALRREVEEVEEDVADDDAWEDAAASAVESASATLAQLTPQEQLFLNDLRDWAARAAPRADSKAEALIRWLHDHVRPGGRWNDQRAIIFTEYRATQKWLQGLMAARGLADGERLATLYGGMHPDDRERVKNAFQAAPATSPVRILLATDAASEGINLQNHCSLLVHYEIPWNPNRMEQRNGRIDRHGQKAEEVFVYHPVPKGWREEDVEGRAPGELEGDLEFLMRAALKVNRIREDLGKVGPVIAAQVEEAMLGRRRKLETTRAERDAEPARRMLQVERDLRRLLKDHADQLNETRDALHLTPERVRQAVDVALELAGQPALEPTTLRGVWEDRRRIGSPVFRLPALRGIWSRCGEGLAHPHTGEIRPMVFDETLARGRDDVVLAHLNHRLVQMCLGLLRAEVWSPEAKLHRVAAQVVPSRALEHPVALAFARLVVLGADNHKLHEELVAAGGELKAGRFRRLNVGEVNAALSAPAGDEAPREVKDRLTELWPQHRESLLAALEARKGERTQSLAKALEARASDEALKLEAVMLDLKRAIEVALGAPLPEQFAFWPDPEREQLERNRASLRARADSIPAEIERETAALRRRYAAPTPRLFPVAVAYLVPEHATR